MSTYNHVQHVVSVNEFRSIADLNGLIGSNDGDSVYVAGYYESINDVPWVKGGGHFVWDSTKLRTEHNGVTIISPTVQWDNTPDTLADYHAGTLEIEPSGAGCWVRQYETLNVHMAGAVGDGVVDDTVAINASLSSVYSSAASIHFAEGIYLYDGGGVLGKGNIIFGAGRNSTFIRSRIASPTSGYLIRALGYGSGIRNIRFDAAVTQTGGSYVWLSAPESFIEHFYMTGDINGVLMTGNVARIQHGRFQNGAQDAIRIRAEGGDNSQLISDVLMGAQNPQVSKAGIRVRNSSALIISNTSVIQQGHALLIDPYSSSAGNNTINTDSGNVFSLYVDNCFFDNSSGNAIKIAPTGSGSVVRCRFANVWASSSQGDGVSIINASSGTVSGIHFTDLHAILNTGSGVSLGGTLSDINIFGGEICQNSFGVYVNNTVSKLSIIGAVIGKGAGVNGNTNNGIVLSTGSSASDFITIVANTMEGNGAAAILDNSTGVNKVIYNNTGSTVTKLQSINSLLDISGASAGQIKFPVTQNPSSDVNTLDDYEEGTWTPSLSFDTPGDLSVAYTSADGNYTKVGRLVTITFQIVTSTFTHTTASGDLIISGMPFTAKSGFSTVGSLSWGGITKAGYTQVVAYAKQGTSSLSFFASGSGSAASVVTASDTPSGGTVSLRGQVSYYV